MRRHSEVWLLGLIWLTVHPIAEKEPITITATSGTLILIGASATDLTVAADSRASTGMGTGETVTKIFSISKFTACTLNNDAGFKVRQGTEVLDTLSFPPLIWAWAKDHPTASARVASDGITQSFIGEMTKFFLRYRGLRSAEAVVSVVCFGYESDVSAIYTADIHASSDIKPFVRGGGWSPPPGFFVALGETQVCEDITAGSSPILSKYRETRAVKTYLDLKSRRALATFTTADLLEMSKTCLVATESKEGLNFDMNANVVGPPNHYASISRTSGYHVLPPPN